MDVELYRVDLWVDDAMTNQIMNCSTNLFVEMTDEIT